MNTFTQELISRQADEIRKKLEKGFIYGESINMDNLNMVMIAAWWLGRMEQAQVPFPFFKIDWPDR